mgnify:CR=1 FL=1
MYQFKCKTSQTGQRFVTIPLNSNDILSKLGVINNDSHWEGMIVITCRNIGFNGECYEGRACSIHA